MKNKNPFDLLILLIWTIITLVFVQYPLLNEPIIMTVLSIPVFIFIPGYVMIAALYPRKDQLEGIERLALSFGLSIALIPFLGILLNFAISIDHLMILIILSVAAIIFTIIAAYRRGKLPNEEKFAPFDNILDAINEGFKIKTGKTDIIITGLLIFFIVLAIGIVYFVISAPMIGERFTEFYILSAEGKAKNYTSKLTYNSPASVIVGVANHEYYPVNYTVEVALDNNVLGDVLFRLDQNQTWEKKMTFIPDREGTNMELKFWLFKEDDFTIPYRELQMRVNVSR